MESKDPFFDNLKKSAGRYRLPDSEWGKFETNLMDKIKAEPAPNPASNARAGFWIKSLSVVAAAAVLAIVLWDINLFQGFLPKFPKLNTGEHMTALPDLGLNFNLKKWTPKAKLNILYLEDMPRREFQHLSGSMLGDPAIELQTFLFALSDHGEHACSVGLNPIVACFEPLGDQLPVCDEFKEMQKYDIIILGSVSLSNIPEKNELGERVRTNLNKYVSEGGNLILLAGSGDNPNAYQADATMKPLLPIVLSERKQYGYGEKEEKDAEDIYGEAFNPQICETGKARAELKTMDFSELPGLYWYFSDVEYLASGAEVLACHPSRKMNGKTDAKVAAYERCREEWKRCDGRVPLLARMKYGEGQVYYIGSDDLHRWRLRVGSLYHYYHFYSPLFRQLTHTYSNEEQHLLDRMAMDDIIVKTKELQTVVTLEHGGAKNLVAVFYDLDLKIPRLVREGEIVNGKTILKIQKDCVQYMKEDGERKNMTPVYSAEVPVRIDPVIDAPSDEKDKTPDQKSEEKPEPEKNSYENGNGKGDYGGQYGK